MKNLALILTLLFSIPAFSGDAVPAPESSMKVDLAHSSFQWTGAKLTGSHTGKISLLSSKIKTSSNGQLLSAELIMNMKSITCEDIKNPKWNKKFLKHMKDEDFFTVQKYPTASLLVEKLDKGLGHGKLTIKGKTVPVTFKYDLDKSKKTYAGTLKFDRTQFGITYKSKSFFKNLGDKFIKNEVSIDFKLSLK